jgi:hypothetical protein
MPPGNGRATRRDDDVDDATTRRRVVKGTCKKQTNVQRLLRVCFAFRADGAAGRLPVFASPAKHAFFPWLLRPDHASLASSRPPRGRTRKQGFSRETCVALENENEKRTKNENTQGCAREPNVSPDALQLSHRDLRVGCVDSPPADILGGGAAAEKTKGYL